MTASLEERIARVLVASTHPELPDRKVDELVRYGVGRATARLVVAECAAWEREQHPLYELDGRDVMEVCPRDGCDGRRVALAGGHPVLGCTLVPGGRAAVIVDPELAPLWPCPLVRETCSATADGEFRCVRPAGHDENEHHVWARETTA